jgi:hypothetical protein
MKEETRVYGPWADRKLFLGESLLKDGQLKPWMHKLIKEIDDHGSKMNDAYFREILHVVDYKGGHMKSSFVKYLLNKYKQDAAYVNPFGTSNQISSCFAKGGAKSLYLLDLPRPFKTKKGYHHNYPEVCTVIEKLKDGIVSSSMYGEGTTLLMDPPFIIIFANWPLENEPGEYFSLDRIREVDLADYDDQYK